MNNVRAHVMQRTLFPMKPNPNDVVYTPLWVAEDMVKRFKPTGRILEPCSGGGAFLQFLPENTEWCEIEKGKDFFAWFTPVDWVFGNPPYSLFTEWLYHSMKIAKNICYLTPIGKVYSSDARMKRIYEWGGIVHTVYYGKGTDLGFPFGFPCAAIHLQKGYQGGATFAFHDAP